MVPRDRTRGKEHTFKYRTILNIRNYCESGQRIDWSSQRPYSIGPETNEDISNPTAHSHSQHAVGWPCFDRGIGLDGPASTPSNLTFPMCHFHFIANKILVAFPLWFLCFYTAFSDRLERNFYVYWKAAPLRGLEMLLSHRVVKGCHSLRNII